MDLAVSNIFENPELGDLKLGDLAGVRVYKFKMIGQLTLLAYLVDNNSITLLSLGSHQNFYRDLKKIN